MERALTATTPLTSTLTRMSVCISTVPSQCRFTRDSPLPFDDNGFASAYKANVERTSRERRETRICSAGQREPAPDSEIGRTGGAAGPSSPPSGGDVGAAQPPPHRHHWAQEKIEDP